MLAGIGLVAGFFSRALRCRRRNRRRAAPDLCSAASAEARDRDIARRHRADGRVRGRRLRDPRRGRLGASRDRSACRPWPARWSACASSSACRPRLLVLLFSAFLVSVAVHPAAPLTELVETMAPRLRCRRPVGDVRCRRRDPVRRRRCARRRPRPAGGDRPRHSRRWSPRSLVGAWQQQPQRQRRAGGRPSSSACSPRPGSPRAPSSATSLPEATLRRLFAALLLVVGRAGWSGRRYERREPDEEQRLRYLIYDLSQPTNRRGHRERPHHHPERHRRHPERRGRRPFRRHGRDRRTTASRRSTAGDVARRRRHGHRRDRQDRHARPGRLPLPHGARQGMERITCRSGSTCRPAGTR